MDRPCDNKNCDFNSQETNDLYCLEAKLYDTCPCTITHREIEEFKKKLGLETHEPQMDMQTACGRPKKCDDCIVGIRSYDYEGGHDMITEKNIEEDSEYYLSKDEVNFGRFKYCPVCGVEIKK